MNYRDERRCSLAFQTPGRWHAPLIEMSAVAVAKHTRLIELLPLSRLSLRFLCRRVCDICGLRPVLPPEARELALVARVNCAWKLSGFALRELTPCA